MKGDLKNMKKKAIIIISAALAALVVLGIVLGVLLKDKYFEKTKFDSIDTLSYNGVDIVGYKGEFYLSVDGKLVSDGYEWIKSVNDYYTNLTRYYAEKESDFHLYDYYIAKEADNSDILIITSSGEKFTVVGANHSIYEVKLPYIVFINNTTMRKSAISLNSLESALSYKSSGDITTVAFDEIELVSLEDDYDRKVISYDLLVATNTVDEQMTYVFDANGEKII
jgi:hypothetical protein